LVKQVLRVLALTLSLALPGCGKAQTPPGPPPLSIERKYLLEGVTGRIDHLAVDIRRHRIFVAEFEDGNVDVVDLDDGKSTRIAGLKEPQGLAYLADRNELVVASGGDGTVRFFNATSLAPTGVIQLGADADNVRFDPASGQVAVGYGSGAIAFIDSAQRTVVKAISLPAHPEGFDLGPLGTPLFVNLPDARSLAVVDRTTGKLTKRWPTTHRLNFPLALDPAAHTVAVVYRMPAHLVLLDDETGEMRQDLETCGDSDDVFFDPPRRRIYVVCGAGTVDVFQEGHAGIDRIARIPTRQGARTGLFVPELDRLFIAVPSAGKAGAALLELRP
jgi:DNA-binding beta-propeller fold protein YncE